MVEGSKNVTVVKQFPPDLMDYEAKGDQIAVPDNASGQSGLNYIDDVSPPSHVWLVRELVTWPSQRDNS